MMRTKCDANAKMWRVAIGDKMQKIVQVVEHGNRTVSGCWVELGLIMLRFAMNECRMHAWKEGLRARTTTNESGEEWKRWEREAGEEQNGSKYVGELTQLRCAEDARTTKREKSISRRRRINSAIAMLLMYTQAAESHDFIQLEPNPPLEAQPTI